MTTVYDRLTSTNQMDVDASRDELNSPTMDVETEESSGEGGLQCENALSDQAAPIMCISVTDSESEDEADSYGMQHLETHDELMERGRSVCTKLDNRQTNMKIHRGRKEKRTFRLNRTKQKVTHSDQSPFECPYTMCWKVFTSRHALRRHTIALHTKELVFPCTKCSMRFYRWDLRRKHLVFEHGEGRLYCCYLCKITSFTRQELRRHMDCTHIRLPRVKCSFPSCSAKLYTKLGLEGHMRRKHSSRTYCCYLCSKTYPMTRPLRQHIEWVHCGQKKHKCPKRNCSMMFQEKDGLVDHLAFRHGEGKMRRCKLCAKPMASMQSLGNHMRLMHSDQSRFKCPISTCSHKTYNMKTLRDHMAFRHGQGPTLSCHLCKKALSKRENLDSHIKRMHSGEPQFKCPINKCNRKFHQKHILKEHLALAHSKGVTFCCHLCKTMFSAKYKLLRHMNCFHVRQIRFKCTFPSCSVEYGRKDHLQRHLAQKHGETPTHTCSACKKSFASKQLLANHTKLKHSNRKYYKCLQCENLFSSNQVLKRHMERFHDAQKKV